MGETVTCDGQTLFLGLDILPGDDQAPLVPAHVHVVPGHISQKRQQYILALVDCRRHLGGGRLDRSALAAKNIDFPGCIKASLVNIILKGDAWWNRKRA